nr:ABC-three component system protein [uncultured Alistipes sp.]
MIESITKQSNISAGGDVAGRDIYKNYLPQVTWYQRKFHRLAEEVELDQRYNKTIEDLDYFETILDGTKGLEEKLTDGGRNKNEIALALRQKQKFAKKQEKYKYYESAQWINSHLFAEILLKFNDYIKPLIDSNVDKNTIFTSVGKMVIEPIVQKLNVEGADDNYLCYDAEDVLGMVYYLTGRCHINWTNYGDV